MNLDGRQSINTDPKTASFYIEPDEAIASGGTRDMTHDTCTTHFPGETGSNCLAHTHTHLDGHSSPVDKPVP